MSSRHHSRALSLSYLTVGYNVIEGVVSIIAGALAGSIALVGFGLDSFVESLSGSVMIWRFRRHRKISEEEEERVERKAVKLIGCSFTMPTLFFMKRQTAESIGKRKKFS